MHQNKYYAISIKLSMVCTVRSLFASEGIL